jgi:hypothetical protein
MGLTSALVHPFASGSTSFDEFFFLKMTIYMDSIGKSRGSSHQLIEKYTTQRVLMKIERRSSARVGPRCSSVSINTITSATMMNME